MLRYDPSPVPTPTPIRCTPLNLSSRRGSPITETDPNCPTRIATALAWQERWKRDNLGVKFGVNNVKVDDEGWIVPSSGDPPALEDKENDAGSANDKKPPKVPRVYYATRTHSQIQQVVRELKRTAYRPAMVVLGSRDHYCIHPSVRKRGRNINDECKQLLERGVRGGGGGGDASGAPSSGEDTGRGCGYSHGAMKLAGNVSRQGAEPLDIEDLVVAGKKSRACPYFAAKHAAEGAELVFCPYNYLLDPAVRSAMDIDVKGAIVILDEAHNVEDTSREAASCDIDLERLEEAAAAFAGVASNSGGDGEGRSDEPDTTDTHAVLGGIVANVARWLRGASDLDHPRCPLRPHGFERWMAVWSGGSAVARQMRDMGLDPASVAAAEEAKRSVAKEANDAKTPADRRVSGAALKTAETLLTSARYALHGYRGGPSGGVNPGAVHDYRLVIQKSFKDARERSRGEFDEGPPGSSSGERDVAVTLSLWALNPALAFNDLAGPGGARCVVLTSGTLAPLSSFASELGVSFPIRMEAPHCVDVHKQVWAGAVGVGPAGASLHGTFKTAAEFAYQDDLGNALREWCRDIPHGVLVFFPSYSLLDRVTQRWKSTGAWKALEQATGKKMFQEPRGNEQPHHVEAGGRGGGSRGGGRGGRAGSRGGKTTHGGSENALDAMLARYYRAVRASVAAAPHAHAPAPESHPARGAVLLAVVRGKVSEGIDFADANARGVMVVGVPYPNVKDKRVELKRLYNNEGVSRGLLSGDQWYSQQAFRALNQAVGRCLRHRNDHGAILLADERYLRDDMTRHLPKWLRPAMRKCAGFEDSRRGLRSFFAMHAREPPPVQPEEPAALKPSVAAGRSEGKQRSSAAPKKTLAVDEEDEAGAGVGGDAKQKDIRSLFAPVGAVQPPATARPPLGPLEHQIPITLAEEEAEQRGGERRAWRPAPVPPPCTTTTTTSELTEPPTQTAQTAREDGTTPAALAPAAGGASLAGAPHHRDSAASVSDGWGDEWDDAWGASPGTQGFGARGWGATQQFVSIQRPPPPPPPRTIAAAAASDVMPPPPPRMSTQPSSGPSPTPDATSHRARDAAAAILGTRVGTPGPNLDPRRVQSLGAEKSSMDDDKNSMDAEDTEQRLDFPEYDAIAGTQAEPDQPEPEPDVPGSEHGSEPGSSGPAYACPSCGCAVLGPGGILGATRTRVDLSYLTTLLESNPGGFTPSEDDEAFGPRTCVVSRADTSAARTTCAQPVKMADAGIEPSNPQTHESNRHRSNHRARSLPPTQLRSPVPEPNWAGDCAGAWVPQDGCYYVPLACRGLWVGARVEAADHEHAHLAGCTLLLEDALAPPALKGGDEEEDSAEEECRSSPRDRPNGDDEDDGEDGDEDDGEEEVADGISIDDCRVGTWVEVHNGGTERENWRGRIASVDPASDRPVAVRWLSRTRDGFFTFRGGSHSVEVETLVELGDRMFHPCVKAAKKAGCAGTRDGPGGTGRDRGGGGPGGGEREVFCMARECRCGRESVAAPAATDETDEETAMGTQTGKRRRIRRYASLEASQRRRR